MHGYVDAIVEAFAQVRRIERRIHHERYLLVVRNRCDRFEVQNVIFFGLELLFNLLVGLIKAFFALFLCFIESFFALFLNRGLRIRRPGTAQGGCATGG